MDISARPLGELAEDDIRRIIGSSEGKTLDFKRDLPGSRDEERKEFCADVSSFANSSGGHIVYGLDEEGGTATAIVPIMGDQDESIRRMQSMIEDGIRPRLRAELRAVPLAAGGCVVVIRIHRSWNAPHMVTMRGHGRF